MADLDLTELEHCVQSLLILLTTEFGIVEPVSYGGMVFLLPVGETSGSSPLISLTVGKSVLVMRWPSGRIHTIKLYLELPRQSAQCGRLLRTMRWMA